MDETTVVIEGGSTNKSFILDLLDQPEVIDGSRRHRLDRPGPRRGPAWSSHRHSGVALVAAGIEALRGRGGARAHPAARDRPRRPSAGAAPDGSRHRPQAARHGVQGHGAAHRPAPLPRRHRQRAPTSTSVDADARPPRRVHEPAHRRRAAPTAWSPPPTARSSSSRSTASPTGSAATRAACCARPPPRSSWPPRPPVGDEVAAGAPVLVLESMKMETVLQAPFAGAVRELLVSRRQPGRDRRPARPARAGRRRGRGGRGRGRREAVDLDLPDASAPSCDGAASATTRRRRPLRDAARLRRRPDATTAAPSTAYLAARDELAAEGRSPLAGGDRACSRCSPTSPS